jgi:hypothetical protein
VDQYSPGEGMLVARIFPPVDACENQVYCEREIGQNTNYRQDIIESATVYAKRKLRPYQCPRDEFAQLEERKSRN